MSEVSVRNAPVRNKDIRCCESNRDLQIMTSGVDGQVLMNYIQGSRYCGKTVEVSVALLLQAIECTQAATPPSGAPIGHRLPTEEELKQTWSLEPHAEVRYIVVLLPSHDGKTKERCTVLVSDLYGAIMYVRSGVGDEQSFRETVAAPATEF